MRNSSIPTAAIRCPSRSPIISCPLRAKRPRSRSLIAEDAPSPFNPLGLKGAGEGGINGAGAAIAGAVDDALGQHGAMTRLPITPQTLAAHMKGRKP